MKTKTVSVARRKIQAAARRLAEIQLLLTDAREILPESLRYQVSEAIRSTIKAECCAAEAAKMRSLDERYPSHAGEDACAAHERMNAEQLAGLR